MFEPIKLFAVKYLKPLDQLFFAKFCIKLMEVPSSMRSELNKFQPLFPLAALTFFRQYSDWCLKEVKDRNMKLTILSKHGLDEESFLAAPSPLDGDIK
jgi:inorganic triphosphatase YgiF